MNSKQTKPKKRRGTTNLQLEGKRFGKLVVLEEMAERKSGHIMWKCLCDCGVEKIIRGASIKSGNTNSCGCLMTKIKKNERYGKLVTVERVKDDNGMMKWLCQCDCGNETLVLSGNLLLGNTKSCGCLTNLNKTLTDEERIASRNILATPDTISYSTWVRHVKERDNYTCRVCGYKSIMKRDIDAHHLDAYQTSEEGRLDVDNGATLCNLCHKLFHILYGKESRKEDFEKFLNDYESDKTLRKIINSRRF